MKFISKINMESYNSIAERKGRKEGKKIQNYLTKNR
jgi:hypothetical protein